MPKAILQEKRVAVNTPVFDESVIVDTLLNDENDDILDLPPLIEAGSPTLSKVNMSDITTFLAKTGYQQVSLARFFARAPQRSWPLEGDFPNLSPIFHKAFLVPYTSIFTAFHNSNR